MTSSLLPEHAAGIDAVPALTPMASPRLLAGSPLANGAEPFALHTARLGRRPAGGAWLLDELERSGLRGRGGAWFPTALKWRGVARAALQRRAIVVINASEGEPLSAKDRALLEHRPHLVIDGGITAAESVGAGEVIIYISRTAGASTRAIRHALRERRRAGLRELPVHVVAAPHRYVAGESSAAVRRVNGGPAKPGFAPPHPSERGVDARPTLVQNAETIAHAALIARFGNAWFRERGDGDAPGTVLVTLSGGVRFPGVYEVDIGTSLSAVLNGAGGPLTPPSGALVGGYFGSWVGAQRMTGLRLAPADVRLGCGVIGVLGAGACGLSEAARIVRYLARESAGQCGPCVYGLRAIAATLTRIAVAEADRGEVARLQRWTAMVSGRGACHHPDGAVNNAVTALDAFSDDLARHLAGEACAGRRHRWLPEPKRHRGWR